MAQKLVLDENIICNAIELRNKERHHDKTCSNLIVLIYKMHHKIVCDKFLWKRYGKRIKERKSIEKKSKEIESGDIHIIRYIKNILSDSNRSIINKKKDAKPLPECIEEDFNSNKIFSKSNKEDLRIARVAIGNSVYALITDDTPFCEWINNLKQSFGDNTNIEEEIQNTIQNIKGLTSEQTSKDDKINMK